MEFCDGRTEPQFQLFFDEQCSKWDVLGSSLLIALSFFVLVQHEVLVTELRASLVMFVYLSATTILLWLVWFRRTWYTLHREVILVTYHLTGYACLLSISLAFLLDALAVTDPTWTEKFRYLFRSTWCWNLLFLSTALPLRFRTHIYVYTVVICVFMATTRQTCRFLLSTKVLDTQDLSFIDLLLQRKDAAGDGNCVVVVCTGQLVLGWLLSCAAAVVREQSVCKTFRRCFDLNQSHMRWCFWPKTGCQTFMVELVTFMSLFLLCDDVWKAVLTFAIPTYKIGE